MGRSQGVVVLWQDLVKLNPHFLVSSIKLDIISSKLINRGACNLCAGFSIGGIRSNVSKLFIIIIKLQSIASYR